MRKVFAVTSGLVVVALVLQFYFAAIGVFSAEKDDLFSIHGMTGRIVLPVLILLNLVAAAVVKAGGRTIWLVVLDLGLLIVQTLLFILVGALFDAGSSAEEHSITLAGTLILGLHAVNGLAILAVALVVARRASQHASGPESRSAADEPVEALSASSRV